MPHIALIFLLLFVGMPIKAVELKVYTGIEIEKQEAYKAEFEALNPGITIKWIAGTNPEIVQKIIHENQTIKGDFIWGLSTTYLYYLNKYNVLAGYKTANFAKLNKNYIDKKNLPEWIGTNLITSVVCYAPKLHHLYGFELPNDWEDLLDSKYKNAIIMPSPVSSYIGLLTVLNWIKIYGEEKAFEYMNKLHQNIDYYSQNASISCQSVANGNHIMAIGLDVRAIRLIENSADLNMLIMNSGIGWDIEGFAVLLSSPNIAEIKILSDFASSKAAEKLYSQFSSVTLQSEKPIFHKFMPKNTINYLKKNDYSFAVKNLDRILQEWQKRYGDKVR